MKQAHRGVIYSAYSSNTRMLSMRARADGHPHYKVSAYLIRIISIEHSALLVESCTFYSAVGLCALCGIALHRSS